MTQLELLYEAAEESDIEINDYHFSHTKKGMCVSLDEYKSIALDKPRIESSAEEVDVLAEELGHYETGSLYLLETTHNSPIHRSNIIHCEGKTKRWKIKKLLPFDDLREAIQSGYQECYELAEHFNLMEDFIREAILYYTESLGLQFFDVQNTE